MELVGVGDQYANSYSALENHIRSKYPIHENEEASGAILDFYIPGELVIVSDDNKTRTEGVGCSITGECEQIDITAPPGGKKSGRISWRQIK